MAAIVSPALGSSVNVGVLSLAGLGVLGTGRSLLYWGKSLGGAEPRRAAVASKAFMALLCLLLLGASVTLGIS